MESVDLDMNDVFGEEMEEGEDIGALGALPDLQDATQNDENEDADNAEVDKRLKALSKGAAKKVVRRPQPKLDADRLTGARGIPILPKVGEKLKFKGKNHEASDLKILMREMEHWAHRLFPKMPFDEVIERVERLGSKSAVKTCIKKIRLDMPLLDDDFVGSGEEGDDVERNEDEAGNNSKSAETMWDELIEEDEAMRAMEIDDHRQTDRHTDRHMNWGEAGDMSANNEPTASTSGVQSAPETPGPSKAPSQTAGQSGTFTPEQLERMERNKQLALERKMKKRGIMTPGVKSSQPSSSQSPMFVATPLRDVETVSSQGATITSTPSSDSQNSQENQQSSDDPLSEVVQAGPSQNIVIDQRQNAQHWCTQTENMDSYKQNGQESDSCAMETDIVENGENTKKTNKGSAQVTKDTNRVTEKGAAASQEEVPDLEAMSEVIPIQGSDSKSHDMQHKASGITKHMDGDDISDDTIQDSVNMSEVIPVQNGLGKGSETKPSKSTIDGEDSKTDNTTSKFEDSEKKPEDIPEQNHNSGLDSTENTANLAESDNDLSQVLPMQNSENIVLKPVTENAALRSSNDETKIIDKSGVSANNGVKIATNIDDKENSVKVAGLNGVDQDQNEFDDELSEEQLIESLDH